MQRAKWLIQNSSNQKVKVWMIRKRGKVSMVDKVNWEIELS
jgi:hypothetical protein